MTSLNLSNDSVESGISEVASREVGYVGSITTKSFALPVLSGLSKYFLNHLSCVRVYN